MGEDIFFFMSENALFQGYFTEVSFDTSEGNQLSYFQNSLLISSATGEMQVSK